MMLMSARSLAQVRPHLSVAWRQQRVPLLAAARTWSASADSSSSMSGTTAAGMVSNRRHGNGMVHLTSFVGGNVVTAPGSGRKNNLRSIFVEAKKKGGKTAGGGGAGGAAGGKGKKGKSSRGGEKSSGDDDDDFDFDFDDKDVVLEDDDELMEMDEIVTEDEDIDVDESIFTAGTEWGELALKSLESVLKDDEFDSNLQIFSFKVSTERRRIYISIDNVKDKFGSPTLDQLSSVSRNFNEILEEAGFPEDVALEIASPGAERQLRLPGDLTRFRDLTMRVTYVEPGDADADGKTTFSTKVMLLTDLDEEQGSCIWKLADVAENRPQAKKGQGMNKKQKEWRLELPIANVTKANLFIDI